MIAEQIGDFVGLLAIASVFAGCLSIIVFSLYMLVRGVRGER